MNRAERRDRLPRTATAQRAPKHLRLSPRRSGRPVVNHYTNGPLRPQPCQSSYSARCVAGLDRWLAAKVSPTTRCRMSAGMMILAARLSVVAANTYGRQTGGYSLPADSSRLCQLDLTYRTRLKLCVSVWPPVSAA